MVCNLGNPQDMGHLDSLRASTEPPPVLARNIEKLKHEHRIALIQGNSVTWCFCEMLDVAESSHPGLGLGLEKCLQR